MEYCDDPGHCWSLGFSHRCRCVLCLMKVSKSAPNSIFRNLKVLFWKESTNIWGAPEIDWNWTYPKQPIPIWSMAERQQFGLSLRNQTSHFDQLFSSMLVQIDMYMHFCFAMLPFPVVVSTRCIPCLVGDPYKPSLALLLGGEAFQYLLQKNIQYDRRNFTISLYQQRAAFHRTKSERHPW